MKTEAMHPSLFIQEELDARGWSLAGLANKMGHKDQAINKLALDLYFEVGPIRANCRIGEHMAQQMAKAFGVSKELFINLENIWLENIK